MMSLRKNNNGFFLTSFIFLFIFIGIPLFADSQYGSNTSNVSIPDNDGWVYSSITISGAPSDATVTGIDAHFSCIHTYSGDLNVDINDAGIIRNYDFWQNEGGSADNPSRTVYNISTFNGLPVNGTWNLWAQDTAASDTGYIDEWWIRIYYTSSTQTYSVYARIDSLSYGTDVDGDGYYETFDFNIGVDGDVYPGSASIYAKMICNTTGQVWWSSSPWTISGTATDYHYFSFDEADFSGYISGNTNLDFTVEIWNSTKTTLLATDTSVTGEPVRADYYIPPTYGVYGVINSLVYGTDADGDGYYETFDFNIGVDGDVYPGSASIYAKMICNTTGQVWWSSSPWTISGTATDYHYFSFDEADFSGYISGNTNLDFTVEIWNSTKTTLLATDTSVTGEPVQADYYVPPSYGVYGAINSLVYGTDADGDGYYETFDFNIGVDGDVYPGSASIYAKMICNTTGQVWWSSSPWTISGTATDYHYFAFDETDFSGYISGNTNLDFTVEIWNSTKNTLLASDTTVAGEPVQADYYDAPTPELVRIHGRMEYIDINGISRPIKYAKIEIRDRDLVIDDVYETYTNGSGNYDITIQNREIDGSGADLIITLYAQGSSVGNPFASHSIVAVRDPINEVLYFFATDETTPYYENNQSEELYISFTFNNHPENGAFSIYDSIVEAYLLVNQYFSETMPSIDVWWESENTFHRYEGEQSGIHLVPGDRWDRDVILHEYGHFIQHTFGFQLGSVGSSTTHTWEEDLRTWPVNRTDEEAMNLAFREAWPTWFSIASQFNKTNEPIYHDLDDANDIPGNYNIENNLETDTSLNNFCSPGEYFECLNGCILWDIYDSNNDGNDNNDTLSLGHDEIWNVVNGSDKPDNITGFWNTWFGQYGYNREMTRIFLDHNISFIAQTPTGPSPANGNTNQPLSLTLNWDDSNNATSYDVYFGTTSNPGYFASTSNSYYPVGPLNAGQAYYWKIVAKDAHAEAEGPVWSFTTIIPITYTLNVTVYPASSGNVTKNPEKAFYNQNEVVQLTATPVSGYTFVGWTGDVIGTANPLSVTMNSNKNITANFTPITYTLNVSVNPSGSGNVTKYPNKSSYNHGEVVQLTAVPASGYTFSGWSGDVISTANPVSVAMNSNRNITANFTPVTYTLNVSVIPSGSGSVTKNPNKSSYNFDEIVQLTATPASGYTFSGWSGDATGIINPLSVTMNSSKTIIANFTSSTHTLSINVSPSDSGSVTTDPSKTFYNHNEVVQLTATPATRYTFTGWSGDAAGTTNPLSITMNSSKTITANFVLMTRTLTVNVNPSGSGDVTKNPDESVYDYDEVVQLTATPTSGFTFTGWSGDASGTANPLSVIMNSNKVITANFAPLTHTLSVSVNPSDSGNVTRNPDKSSYSYNEVVQLTATPTADYTFSGWSGDAFGTTNPLSVTMNSNKTITANFIPSTSEGNLSVIPVEDFNSSGVPGGPFTPSSKAYTVTNTGGTSINFSVTKSAEWITLLNSGQTLSPNESVIVTISINDSANSLNAGAYNDPVIFTNTTNSNGNTNRNVELNISEQLGIIVTSPNGGDTWEVGSAHEITWTSTGMNEESNVTIEYSIDNGNSWKNIAPYTPNDGSYSWSVPDTPSNNCLVRISGSSTDEGPSDVNDSVFSIVSTSTIAVTSPNGGENLPVGTTFDITWSTEGTENIENVRIEYSTNRGSSWRTIISSTVNGGSYNWTVPDSPSDSCLVRISGLDKDIHPSDVSNKVFSIVSPSVITVTSPNGGESLMAGSPHEITWVNAGTDNFDNVKIEYSTNNGTSWTEVTASAGNNGNYVWTVPDSSSDNCLVRISDSDGEPSDVSDAVFIIVSSPSVTLISPNGGESWEVGSSHNITWSGTGFLGNLKIEYSTDNGTSWITIESSTPNDGSFNWTVTDTPSDNCLVRIGTSGVDESVADVSNGIFSIVPPSSPNVTVTSPNGGEELTVGSIHQVSWTTTGTVDNIKIEYSINSGTSWEEIAASIPNSGSFEWLVPDMPSVNCKVRISEVNGEPSDISDAEFSVVPSSSTSVTVISPNGGEILEIGSVHGITWTNTGMNDADNVIIGYSVDGGISWIDIAISPANNGSYNWTVPDNPSANCMVRINGSDMDEEAADVSDAEFSIVPPSSGAITVTSPNGGESLTEGSTHEITWTSTGTVNDLSIEYSTNRGASWLAIVESIANTGSYNWTVPDIPSDECLVRLSAIDADKDPSDKSDALFSITSASLAMIAPNGNEILQSGKNIIIKWESEPQIGNVKLEYSTDNGSIYFPINDSIPNTGSYEWEVPRHISSNCLVRVSDADGWIPLQHTLQYELKFKISDSSSLTASRSESFVMWLGDVLNEPIKDFISKISITRKPNGNDYIQFDETIKKIPQAPSIFSRWNRLHVQLNQETRSASLWLNGQMIFENIPLKPGFFFSPAASFSIEAGSRESSTSMEIDDFTVRILNKFERENGIKFIALFTENFERFEEGTFPVNEHVGWKKNEFINRKKNQNGNSKNIKQSVVVKHDFLSGMKYLKIEAIEENRVTVVRYFHIPDRFPFDTSDKPFEIRY